MQTLTEQVQAVAKGAVSPVELVTAALENIERVEDLTNAFTVVVPDDALARARNLERQGPRGPLHGAPVAVKDLYDVAGITTSGSCAAYLDRLAYADSAVVDRLRAAGAIVVAKTNMHELAFGVTSQVSCYGPVRNPWDTSRIPAGSSGGSGAAVAAGAVTMAMGSDTGGSIRLPSSMCGVTGLKPTHGAVSLRGALPMTASFDTGGPLAVSAEDCLLVHRVISGFDPEYRYSTTGPPLEPKPLEQTRIGVLRDWIAQADAEVVAAVEVAAKTFEGLGCRVVDAEGPDNEGIRNDVFALLTGEFAHHFRDLWDDERVSEPIKSLIDLGRQMTAADYTLGREASLATRMEFVRLFEDFDVLLCPGAPCAAPRIDAVDNITEAVRSTVFTLPVNAAGLPGLAFPIGFSSDGLPLGGQLIGPAWSETVLCSLGASYQETTDWHLRRADLVVND